MSVNEVTYKPWVKRGIMMVNAECLDIDDPDHIYNQIAAQGVKPEDFGIQHPHTELFKDMSRGDLISEILSLRKELEAYACAI